MAIDENTITLPVSGSASPLIRVIVQGQIGNNVALGSAGIDSVNGNNGTDTVIGGGNGHAADPSDPVLGETIGDAFAFDAEWVHV